VNNWSLLNKRSLDLALGSLYQTTNQIEPAKDAYEKALSIYRELRLAHADVPDYRAGQANALHNLGNLHRLRTYWHPSEAQKFYQEALPIREELTHTHPEVVEYQDELATTLNALGNLYASALGQPMQRAEAFYEQALRIRERLALEHPSDADYQERLASTLTALGHVYKVNGKPDQAKKSFERALPIRQQLVRIHPDVQDYQAGLVRSLHDLGLFHYETDQIRQARERFEEALPLAEKLALRHKADSSHQITWTQLRLHHMWTLARSGEHAAAADAAALLAKAKQTTARFLYDVGRTYALCVAAVQKDTQTAAADREQLAEDYARRAAALLRRAVQAGFNDLKNLKTDPDLEPLHGRADFRQLVQKLEAKVQAAKP
jgi:tetratricopeptide (TPR) repeat protein